MKWLLVVMVFGTTPIETDLVYDTLDQCLKAEELMRGEYARVFEKWETWAKANPEASGYPDSRKFMESRIGLSIGTCIPANSKRSAPQ